MVTEKTVNGSPRSIFKMGDVPSLTAHVSAG